jgi:hypothetical protein
VGAGRAAGSPQRDDMGNLGQAEAETAGARDETEQSECLRWIDAIAGRRALRRREDAPRLVHSQRLAADPTLDG